ncbi:MAG: alkyl sulfatase dimerization domain-containing protein, partial [Alphaproteobacteria bacterium]
MSAHHSGSGRVSPAVHPDLAAHAARFSPKIVQTGQRTHTLIGYNIANVSVIDAPEGLILVDAMAQENDARRARADIQARFPDKTIKAVIYTHFHNDHVNGVEGFVSAEDVASGGVAVWAHADLMHFITEVSAGTGPIMGRRASYTFGAALPRGEEGFVHAGLGLPHNPGPRGFIAPTRTVSERTGVNMCGLSLELIPIPSETDDMLGVYLPDEEIFLTGDCIQGENYPNLYTLRGTPYRDPMQWVRTLDWIRHDLRPRAVVPHHGHPLTEPDAIDDVLTAYRDAIQFTHDQTVRFINQGYGPQEIARRLEMPPHLAAHPWLGEFYGTLRHCIPAIFVGKIGWFAGDPVDLDPLPKPERAARMVRLMGGVEAVRAEAETAMDAGDYLWAAEMLAYLVTLAPDQVDIRAARAEALRGWSYAQSNPNWRNWGL